MGLVAIKKIYNWYTGKNIPREEEVINGEQQWEDIPDD